MEDGFSLKNATVGIIGLGLMGGSLAMALKGKCARLIGFDSHPPTLEFALSKRIIDQAESDPANCLPELDLLILATPVPAILNILKQLQDSNCQPALSVAEGSPITLLDLGSTKHDITRAMSALPANFAPLGGHPICGKEKLGIENASADLYQGAPFVITPLERTTHYALRITRELISTVGAHLIEMTAEKHDRVLASTSHLPFLVSSALARSTPQEFAPLIGPGFRSTARLAGTPSSMMMSILQSNRDNILNAIQTFRQSLDEIEVALENENYLELQTLLDQSCDSYYSLTDH
jgi:prephenate dehydrogenase